MGKAVCGAPMRPRCQEEQPPSDAAVMATEVQSGTLHAVEKTQTSVKLDENWGLADDWPRNEQADASICHPAVGHVSDQGAAVWQQAVSIVQQELRNLTQTYEG